MTTTTASAEAASKDVSTVDPDAHRQMGSCLLGFKGGHDVSHVLAKKTRRALGSSARATITLPEDRFDVGIKVQGEGRRGIRRRLYGDNEIATACASEFKSWDPLAFRQLPPMIECRRWRSRWCILEEHRDFVRSCFLFCLFGNRLDGTFLEGSNHTAVLSHESSAVNAI